MFPYVHYILFELENPLMFRIRYLIEKIGKISVITLNRSFWFHLPLFFLFHEDYILKNIDGIWNIKHGSDYDTLISPLFEPELRNEFHLDRPGYGIDIGAHIGKWSIFVAKQHPENRVLAIDANRYTFAYLEKNIRDNALGNQITPVHIGLSEKEGTAMFDYDTVNTGTSGIDLGKTGKSVEKMEVALKTFDQVISEQWIPLDAIRLIKIDVEWHEWSVFAGMKGFLENKKNGIKIICEIHPTNPQKQEILDQMKAYWYALRFVPGNTVDHIFYQ